MRHEASLIEQLLHLGEKTLENALKARPKVYKHLLAALEDLTKKLGLVTREEFDALHAVLSKARMTQEALKERLESVEKQLKLSRSSQKVTTKKRRLPSVKHAKRGKLRKS